MYQNSPAKMYQKNTQNVPENLPGGFFLVHFWGLYVEFFSTFWGLAGGLLGDFLGFFGTFRGVVGTFQVFFDAYLGV